MMELVKITLTASIFFLTFYLISSFTNRIFSGKWHYYMSEVCLFLFLLPIHLLIKNSKVYENKVIAQGVSGFIEVTKGVLDKDYVTKLIVLIWLLGCLICISLNIINYLNFKNKISIFDISDKKLEKILYECKEKLNIKCDITIKRNSQVYTPLVLGFIDRVIRIPYCIKDNKELELVITHELIHIKRKDIMKKLINSMIVSIHWFNPIVRIANNNTNRWCEISCDELVVEDRDYYERKIYGNVLLKVIEDIVYEKNIIGIGLCNEGKYIKRRLYIMLNAKEMSIIKSFISAGTFILILAIIIPISSFSISNQVNHKYFSNELSDKTDEYSSEKNNKKMDININTEIDMYTGRVSK